MESNFKLITGSAAHNQAVVAGKKLKKVDAYKSLGEYISQKSKLEIPWDTDTTKGRYTLELKKYKQTN